MLVIPTVKLEVLDLYEQLKGGWGTGPFKRQKSTKKDPENHTKMNLE